jgi:hypothetical protein
MLLLDKDVVALSRADRLAGLKRIVPRKRIKEILARAGKDRTFCSRLPGVFTVWFVLAMGLFCRDCYRQVFRWLQRWGGHKTVPGRSTLCEARHRLGVAPFVQLARETVKLLADEQTPGAFYRGMRLMALDGFVVDLPDTPENERVFGRPSGSRAPGAFPQARVVALCEAATHVIYKWSIKPIRVPEQPMADGLVKHLTPQMLLMWDRGFLSYNRVKAVMQSRAGLLARVQNRLVFKPLVRLSDGSFLAKSYRCTADRTDDRNGIGVRIIEYSLDDPNRPGFGHKHRLLTTLLDEKLDPAPKLIELYHVRWEEELGIDEIKTHEMERPTLRSQTPAGVVQELYALLIDHFIVRTLMFAAARKGKIDPRRISFTGTLKILRCRLGECPRTSRGQRRWWSNLLEEISEEIIPPRRNRINPRVIKRKMSKWKKKRPEHRRYPQPTKDFRSAIVMIH